MAIKVPQGTFCIATIAKPDSDKVVSLMNGAGFQFQLVESPSGIFMFLYLSNTQARQCQNIREMLETSGIKIR